MSIGYPQEQLEAKTRETIRRMSVAEKRRVLEFAEACQTKLWDIVYTQICYALVKKNRVKLCHPKSMSMLRSIAETRRPD